MQASGRILMCLQVINLFFAVSFMSTVSIIHIIFLADLWIEMRQMFYDSAIINLVLKLINFIHVCVCVCVWCVCVRACGVCVRACVCVSVHHKIMACQFIPR